MRVLLAKSLNDGHVHAGSTSLLHPQNMPQQLRPIPAFLVFMSGYSPLGLVIAALDFDFAKLEFNSPWTVFAVVAFFIAACIFTARHFVHYTKGDRVTVKRSEDCSVHLLNYAMPYIAGFAGFDTSSPGNVLAIFIVIWVVFYVTYKTHTVVVNPFLLGLGYRLKTISYVQNESDETISTLAVTKFQVATGDTIRIRSIATSCVVIVAVVNHAD